MTLSSKQLKALDWFIKEKKLRLSLSTPPTIWFRNEKSEMVKHDINGIVLEHKSHTEEDRKERARQKRVDTSRPTPRVI